jgi:hypothetical protein
MVPTAKEQHLVLISRKWPKLLKLCVVLLEECASGTLGIPHITSIDQTLVALGLF